MHPQSMDYRKTCGQAAFDGIASSKHLKNTFLFFRQGCALILKRSLQLQRRTVTIKYFLAAKPRSTPHSETEGLQIPVPVEISDFSPRAIWSFTPFARHSAVGISQ